MYRDAEDDNVRKISVSNGIRQVRYIIFIYAMNLKITWPLSIGKYCRRV